MRAGTLKFGVAIETSADTTLHQLRRRPGPDPIECELAEEFLRETLAAGGRAVALALVFADVESRRAVRVRALRRPPPAAGAIRA